MHCAAPFAGHWDFRHAPQAHGPCDMRLGAVNLTKTRAVLTKISQYIKSEALRDGWPASTTGAATSPVTGTASIEDSCSRALAGCWPVKDEHTHCQLCEGKQQQQLKAAGCTALDIERYCASPPPVPAAQQCIVCPASKCRVGCAADLGKPGSAPGHCIPCPNSTELPPDNVAAIDVSIPTETHGLSTMQLGINAPNGVFCPCNIAKGCKAPLNATLDLIRLAPQFVRTHDVYLLNPQTFSVSPPNPLGQHTFNWGDLFPSLDADPSSPSSYNFTIADEWAAEFDALDIPLLMRLGTGWFSPPAMTNVPDNKAEILSEAFLHFVMHFNDGWGGGKRKPTSKIKYWEVWK